MSRQGRGGVALLMTAIASFIGQHHRQGGGGGGGGVIIMGLIFAAACEAGDELFGARLLRPDGARHDRCGTAVVRFTAYEAWR